MVTPILANDNIHTILAQETKANRQADAATKKDARRCAWHFTSVLATSGNRLSNRSEVVVATATILWEKSIRFTEISGQPYNFKRPVAVIYLGTEEDAVIAISMAKEAGCRVCARSGGHDTSGASVCTGAIVVDTSRLIDVTVNVAEGYAIVQAGIRFQRMDDVFQAHGVSAIHGLCPTVSVSGYTLGGGWGALSKLHGAGCDNVLSYTVATAGHSSLIVADDTGPYRDLFFALRGAGHTSYGVMTSLKYKVFPITTDATGQVVFRNVTQNPQLAAEALHFWQQNYLNKGPREISLLPNLAANSDTGTFDLVFASIYGSSDADATTVLDAALQPLTALGGTVSNLQVEPYGDSGDYVANLGPAMLDDQYTGPAYWMYRRGQFVTKPLSVTDYLKLVNGVLSSPKGYVSEASEASETLRTTKDKDTGKVIYRMAYLAGFEGAMTDKLPTDMAFSHRSVGFDLVVDAFASVAHPHALKATTHWQQELYNDQWAGIFGPTAYQNSPSVFYQPRLAALEAYYSPNVCRLVQIKAKYDPESLFGSEEQGIPPSLPGC